MYVRSRRRSSLELVRHGLMWRQMKWTLARRCSWTRRLRSGNSGEVSLNAGIPTHCSCSASTRPAAARAPGPGPIRKPDWKPFANKFLKDRKVILHTDGARTYKLWLPGVLHDNVVHKKKKAIIAGKTIWIKPQYAKIWTHTHTPFPMARSSQWRLAPRSLIASGATSGPTWNMRPEKWDPANKRLFFFLEHGCHAALDAPKKVPCRSCGPSNKGCLVHSRAKEEFTTVALCSWCAVRFWFWGEFFQALPRPPALTSFLQRERVALGTLFFPPPVLRLSGDAGEVWEILHATTF